MEDLHTTVYLYGRVTRLNLWDRHLILNETRMIVFIVSFSHPCMYTRGKSRFWKACRVENEATSYLGLQGEWLALLCGTSLWLMRWLMRSLDHGQHRDCEGANSQVSGFSLKHFRTISKPPIRATISITHLGIAIVAVSKGCKF
jgi:hypothetical protein